jgi:hypothetical protein
MLMIYRTYQINDAKALLFAYDTNITVTNSNQGKLPAALKKISLI